MILFIICITVLYLVLIMSFAIGFDKVKTSSTNESKPETTFTIVIPFKNEAANLKDLLESVANINYPKELFEVILVNDESEDDSVRIIQKVTKTNFSEENINRTRVRIIDINRETISPKKDAIKTAINQAKFDWIVTTDADCILPKNWLACYNNFIQQNDTKFIAGPVSYHETDSFLKQFQTLDFLSLIGSTIGGFGIQKPFMVNGANLAYEKNLFLNLNGFEGNANIASGDDIFLLEKALRQYPNNTHYLKSKEAIVSTKPQPDLTKLISQRIRWAAKTSAYSNSFAKLVGLTVLLMNASLIFLLLLSLIVVSDYKLLAYIFVVKFCIDLVLIYKSARFFNQTNVLQAYFLSSFLYPFFSVYVAILSLFRGYKWKGRYYKK